MHTPRLALAALILALGACTTPPRESAPPPRSAAPAPVATESHALAEASSSDSLTICSFNIKFVGN
jgi:hypothetical protein